MHALISKWSNLFKEELASDANNLGHQGSQTATGVNIHHIKTSNESQLLQTVPKKVSALMDWLPPVCHLQRSSEMQWAKYFRGQIPAGLNNNFYIVLWPVLYIASISFCIYITIYYIETFSYALTSNRILFFWQLSEVTFERWPVFEPRGLCCSAIKGIF